MTEKQLIKRFREISDSIYEKEILIEHGNNSEQLLLDELKRLKQEKESIEIQLRSIMDKNPIIEKTENVGIMLNELYKKFSRKDYPHKFSRDQGTIRHAEILIKIIDDIYSAFDHNIIVTSEYYLEKESEFESDEIVRILKESVDYLHNNKIDNYPELYEFVKSIQKQIYSLDPDCGRMNTY